GLQVLGGRGPGRGGVGRRRVVRGADLAAATPEAIRALRGRRIGFVPQNPTTALDPAWRIGALLAETLAVHGVATGEAAQARITSLLAEVGLGQEGIGRRYPHQLSGGQQQRVCIALALACDPALVVLDEPTTGLDVTTQAQIVSLLRGLRDRHGLAMLYITHDLGVLAQIADRIAVMYAGHMVETGPADALLADPLHPYTRGLIASAPRIEGGAGQQLLRGSLRRDLVPEGCAFAPRCDHVLPACAATPQMLDPVPGAPGRHAACMRLGDLREVTAVTGPPPRAAPDRATPLLEVEGLELRYPVRGTFTRSTVLAVKPATLAVAEGEVLALVGESGSGKSTLARGIIGLLRHTKGTIRFRGRILAPRAERRTDADRRLIQYVFQNPDASLNPAATIGANIARALPGTGAAAVRAALEAVQLDPGYAARFPDELSGGERQRAALARALLPDPDLILCDEILSALDVSVQASVIALLQRLRAERNLALLFISHDLAVVRDLADRVAVLYAGEIVQTAPTAALFSGPRHPYTQALIAATPRLTRMPALPATQLAPPRLALRGCPYAPRCPQRVGGLCDATDPPEIALPGGGRLRCHLAPEALPGARPATAP
ncbi:MAG: ABC transporter ATP-binding protein, partial [Rubellimicrobium sp.]|nr:ABC transporter ATP-binding protein [Rubellimicrobium sp.]